MTRSKYYPPELKKRVVDEVQAGGKVAPVARRYGVSRTAIYRWLAEDQVGLLLNQSGPISAGEAERLVNEVNRLKKLLGEKELENAILRDLLKKRTQRSEIECR